jgi:hypothetical protein
VQGSFKTGLIAGVLAGVMWGWVSFLVNSISGAFPFEHTLTYNLVIFSIAGAIFGLITAGFLLLIGEKLPFKSLMARAILISTSFWLILRLGGAGLALAGPERYHPDVPQTIQGFFLAMTLGIILSLFWKKEQS